MFGFKLSEQQTILYNVTLVMLTNLPNGWPVRVPRDFTLDLEIYFRLHKMENEYLEERLVELNG